MTLDDILLGRAGPVQRRRGRMTLDEARIAALEREVARLRGNRRAAMPRHEDAMRCISALIGEIDGAGEAQKKTPWMKLSWSRRKTWVRWLDELRYYIQAGPPAEAPERLT